jgi:hypothetical protein
VDAVKKSIEVKTFDKPDETREFEGKGWADFCTVGGKTVARGHFEPGWSWAGNVKPIVGGDMCQVSHMGYVLEGRMRVIMADGSEQELVPGEVVAIHPGHNAEVVGNETCVFVDFGEIAEYALRK